MIKPADLGSPSYIFDLDEFYHRCCMVKDILGDIPITYSMKANPFLLNRLPDCISHVEVCSPGELAICRCMNISPDRIIYSGVMKEQWDIQEAVDYGVDILTAESMQHLIMECETSMEQNKVLKVLLRLTSGNQFGMREDEILDILSHRELYPGIHFYGIHYYSGTQKSMRQIRKDFQRLKHLLDLLKCECDYSPELLEYGPGIGAEYFADQEDPDQAELHMLEEVAEFIHAMASKYPVGIEMGRFLASSCGHYLTRVTDGKVNADINYLILDGGIHHLKYYGQSMAIQVPHMDYYPADIDLSVFSHRTRKTAIAEENSPFTAMEHPITYTLCGSLCTTADILVRDVELPRAHIGDYLMFHRCGAYSVTEAGYLFLSRTMPGIWLYDQTNGYRLARRSRNSYELNLTEAGGWV